MPIEGYRSSITFSYPELTPEIGWTLVVIMVLDGETPSVAVECEAIRYQEAAGNASMSWVASCFATPVA